MNLRVAIVDDEKPARSRLRRLLSEHADVEIVGEAGDADAAVDLIDREKPDLCFLDVQMPAGDAFDVLARLRHRPLVVFTTAYDRYAVRAFEVRSVDYLLKPFGRDRFAEALDRARRAVAAGAGPDLVRLLQELRSGLPSAAPDSPARPQPPSAPVRIPGRRGARIVLLDPHQVLWFEAEETLVFARIDDGRILVERSLAELEESLASTFFRTHRSYLVNLSKIADIHPGEPGTWEITIRDEKRSVLPLSRRQAQRLREIIPW